VPGPRGGLVLIRAAVKGGRAAEEAGQAS
jgi:hypothetical protein